MKTCFITKRYKESNQEIFDENGLTLLSGKTCSATKDLIRFTEVRALFNCDRSAGAMVLNNWINFFDEVKIIEHKKDWPGVGWLINAGQVIPSKIRNKYKTLDTVDLTSGTETINFTNSDTDMLPWMQSFDNMELTLNEDVKKYQDANRHIDIKMYYSTVLKSALNFLYAGNTEKVCDLPEDCKTVWVPASGTLAYQLWRQNPKIKVIIYDINPLQIEFARWLNARTTPPRKLQVRKYVRNLSSILGLEVENLQDWEDINSDLWSEWIKQPTEYRSLDLFTQSIPTNEYVYCSNICVWMPCYHRWGWQYINDWKNKHKEQTLYPPEMTDRSRSFRVY